MFHILFNYFIINALFKSSENHFYLIKKYFLLYNFHLQLHATFFTIRIIEIIKFTVIIPEKGNYYTFYSLFNVYCI